MSRANAAILILSAILIQGCQPPQNNSQSEEDSSASTSAAPSTQKQSSEEIQRDQDPFMTESELKQEEVARAKIRNFSLISGAWEKYLQNPPQIYALQSVSLDVSKLLKEEQDLIKAVIETDVSVSETSDYGSLEDQLDELKATIPGAATSTGYVQRRKYYNRSYVSSSGTIYTNSSPSYSYSVFRAKEKSTSPDLVRSVQSIAGNATLEDLDQRIDALQRLTTQWKRRISQMSTNGTEGIMRDANQAYIDGLEHFTKDFIRLRRALREVEEAQSLKQEEKASILSRWQQFEQQKLPLLHNYFKTSEIEVLSAKAGMDYDLTTEQLEKELVLVCAIGPRTLYFEIEGRHPSHPFILADITPLTQ